MRHAYDTNILTSRLGETGACGVQRHLLGSYSDSWSDFCAKDDEYTPRSTMPDIYV